ncbi:MAG: 50S ribosomal protein L25/general stress protein Ctc [Cytophagaceae bacterium]
MKKIEIIGFKRANLGKTESKKLRLETNVPCVLYGGKEQTHFHAPAFLFRDLVYTPEVHIVDLTIEGKQHECIMQDIQFDPVNDMILHVDFLELVADKAVKMDIPVKFVGAAPGVMQGGKLMIKLPKVTVKALPKNLPDFIEVDVTKLDLGKSVRVGDIKPKNFTILNSPSLPLASVQIPRALKLEDETATAVVTADATATDAKPADAKAGDAKPGDKKAEPAKEEKGKK